MKTSPTLTLIGLTLAIGIGPAAVSAAPRDSESTPARENRTNQTLASISSVSGEITSVNASGKSFEVRNSRTGDTSTVNVDDETVIMLDGKSAQLDDLKAGQTVVVTTEQKEGKSVASSISARNSGNRSGAPAAPSDSPRSGSTPGTGSPSTGTPPSSSPRSGTMP